MAMTKATDTTDESIRDALDAGATTISVSAVAGWRILASNYAIVMQRTDGPDENGRMVPFHMGIELMHFTETPRPHTANAAKMRTWCEKHIRGKCHACLGLKTIEVRCPHKGCKHRHEVECERCEGTGEGTANPGDIAPVSIRGTNVNAVRLARMLALFDGPITYGGEDLLGTPVLAFGTGDMMAVLTCLRPDEKPRAKWTKD